MINLVREFFAFKICFAIWFYGLGPVVRPAFSKPLT